MGISLDRQENLVAHEVMVAGPTMRTIKVRLYSDLIELLENSSGSAPDL